MKNKIKKYIELLIGSSINAYAVTCILRPNGLMSGGITGLTRVIEGLTIDLIDSSFLLEGYLFNIIFYMIVFLVLILSRILLGKEDFLKIAFLSVFYPTLLTLFTWLNLPPLVITHQTINGDTYVDVIVLSIVYGILIGIGTGLTLRSGFTTGGTDTIAKILYRKVMPHIKYSQILLIVDGVIITMGLFLYGIQVTIYAIIIKFLSTKVVEAILLGVNNNLVKLEIISDKTQEIIEYIQVSIHRGVTCLEIEGQYKKEKMHQIITICSPKECIKIKNYIAKIDDKAFVHYVTVPSVWGNGFRSIHNDELT
jgi:uncharacterized membrane-anchored protein YitT (DUF2179 family)